MDNINTDDAEESSFEGKRLRYDTKSYITNSGRKNERGQRLRKTRFNSKDFHPKNENVEALIFDSGAYSIKVNYSSKAQAKIIPNCIMKAKSERKRLFIGDQIDECRDCSGLFYLLPCERGYITKWDVQKPIWDYVFSKNCFPLADYPLIMTQPLFNFKSIQDCIDEIFFEEYEINAMVRLNPSDLAYLKYREEFGDASNCCIIVDSGYSFTHIIPYIEGKKYWNGIKRLNVGGKLLTNHLKDIISYRQYHVMEETYVINQVKEDTCFVSMDFKKDLKTASLSGANNDIVRNYVLPDFNNIRRGYIQNTNAETEENYQILKLNNERFTVPEILFHPSDIGMKQIGIAEAVFKSILSCPTNYQKHLAKNIVLIGGNAKFPNFKERFYNEIRSTLCAAWEVHVYQPKDPVTYSWSGGKSLLRKRDFKNKLVTKEQYEELGLSAIQEKFNDWYSAVEEETKQKEDIKTVSYIDHIKKYDVFGKGIINNNNNNNDNNNDNESESENVVVEENSNDSSNKEQDVTIASDNDANNDLNDARHKTGTKSIKKVLRGSTPIVYSVKIVSTAVKPS